MISFIYENKLNDSCFQLSKDITILSSVFLKLNKNELVEDGNIRDGNINIRSNTWGCTYDMDILFIIGLPRSGTSLVQKLIHEATGRKSPTFRQFGVDVSSVPRAVRDLNRTFKDEGSLAEDNDFPGYAYGGDFTEYRAWLERRGAHWVCKSPDHLGRLPELWDVFPEARCLWCIRPAGPTLGSIREYWQVTGLGPTYDIMKAVRQGLQIARAHTDLIDVIYTPSIPEWESDRVDGSIQTKEVEALDVMFQQVRGLCRNVSSNQFKQYYSREGTGASGA